jgi:hypothetical protein
MRSQFVMAPLTPMSKHPVLIENPGILPPLALPDTLFIMSLPYQHNRPLPASNVEWLLELALVIFTARSEHQVLSLTGLPFLLPRGPKRGASSVVDVTQSVLDQLPKRQTENDVPLFVEAYLKTHCALGHLSAAEAKQVQGFVEENLLVLAELIENLERAQSAKPKAATLAPDAWFEIKVTLQGVKPSVWRRLRVPANIKLLQLHEVIQEAMGWLDGHLHQFRLGHANYAIPSEEDFRPPDGDERKYRLDQLISVPKDRLHYDYDFGDGWEHTIVLEKIVPLPASGKVSCTGGKNACPPEDVGGPPGYERMLAALADPADEEHESYLTWIGRSFDPRHFDLAAVNHILASIKLPRAKLAVVK